MSFAISSDKLQIYKNFFDRQYEKLGGDHTHLKDLAKAMYPESISDPAHGYVHNFRVFCNATEIWYREPRVVFDSHQDIMVNLAVASILHDAVSYPKNSELRAQSSTDAMEFAKNRIRLLELSEVSQEVILDAILSHSYSAGHKPKFKLSEIFQDADRLESMGAVGLTRILMLAGVHGRQISQLENFESPLRELDELNYAFDHIPMKIAKLPGLMNTEVARREANKRLQFMTDFVQRYHTELEIPLGLI